MILSMIMFVLTRRLFHLTSPPKRPEGLWGSTQIHTQRTPAFFPVNTAVMTCNWQLTSF